MEEVIFIDPNGNIIQYKEICSHIGLAIKLVNENEELKKLYISKECPRADLFLIKDIGYISVSIDPIYGMHLTANTQRISNTQKEIIQNYLMCGAKMSLVDDDTNKKSINGRHQKIIKK